MKRTQAAVAYLRALLLWVAALLLAFLIVFGLSRGLGALFGADPRSLDAGVIATFTGVAGGVPVALLIGRLFDAERRRLAAVERKGRRVRLLQTIQRDLTESLLELVDRDRSRVIVPYLRTDVWTTLSASGQFGLIDDPDLLGILARAYHRIATTADLERHVWEAFHDPAQWAHRIDRATGVDVSARFRQSLEVAIRDQDPHTKAAIDVALERIARELGEEPPQDRQLRVDRFGLDDAEREEGPGGVSRPAS